MDNRDMRNIVVLKNLPSNIIEEAIVVIKENKKAKKYQYIDSEKSKDENLEKNKDKNGYILKEAELIIDNYISNLETKYPKGKNDVKELKTKYYKSVKLNIILGFATVISIILSLI